MDLPRSGHPQITRRGDAVRNLPKSLHFTFELTRNETGKENFPSKTSFIIEIDYHEKK